MRSIPAYVMSVDDERMLQLALIENIQREDLNPIDIAQAYDDLIETHGLTHGEVADRVGKNRSTVANFLRLLTLPPEIKDALRKGEVSQGHARALLAFKDVNKIKNLFRKLMKNGLSVRQVEEMVKRGDGAAQTSSSNKQKPLKSPQLKAIENDLMMKLGTKVKIREKGSGGELLVEYYSDEDLDRLIELFGKLAD